MEQLLPYIKAFFVGGLLCIPAQIMLDKTKMTPARILTFYVVAGVALGALGLYRPLADFAGNGALTPLTGFGYGIAKGVKAAIDEKGFWGILTGSFTAAAGGIMAALACGILAALFGKSRSRG